MKRYLIFSIIFLAANAMAQRNDVVHSFNIWAQGGYSNLFVKSDGITNRGGVGGIFGLGYGFRHNRFILETGLEFDYKRSLSKYGDSRMQIGRFIDKNTGEEIALGTKITAGMHPIVDGGFIHTEYIPEVKFVMEYKFTGLQDLYQISYVNLPLRVGGTFNGFYFLVGSKIGLNVLSYAETSGKHSSAGYFPQDIGYLSDMPHHSFVNNIAGGENTHFNGKLNLNLAASAEVGVNFILSNRNTLLKELRLAFFADYGLLNINSSNYISTENSNGDFVYVPATDQAGLDPNILKYNSLITSNIKPSVHPFIAGMKLTLLFTSQYNHCKPSNKNARWWVIGSKRGYRR